MSGIDESAEYKDALKILVELYYERKPIESILEDAESGECIVGLIDELEDFLPNYRLKLIKILHLLKKSNNFPTFVDEFDLWEQLLDRSAITTITAGACLSVERAIASVIFETS